MLGLVVVIVVVAIKLSQAVITLFEVGPYMHVGVKVVRKTYKCKS